MGQTLVYTHYEIRYDSVSQQHLHCAQMATQHKRGRKLERSTLYTTIELTTLNSSDSSRRLSSLQAHATQPETARTEINKCQNMPKRVKVDLKKQLNST